MPVEFERPPAVFLGAGATHVRNDLLANGKLMRNAVCRQINHLTARQGQVFPGKNLAGRTVRNSASALRLWTTRAGNALYSGQLVVDVQLLPTDTSAGAPRWWLEVNGVSQGDQFHNVRCAAGSGTNFSDIFEMQQVISVAGGEKLDIWTDDNCRVVGWDMHEKPLDVIDGAGSDFADYSYVLPLSSVRDDFYRTAATALAYAWALKRGQHLSWGVDDPATPIAVSSTVAADLWGSASVGPTAPTQYRNTYSNENCPQTYLGYSATKAIAGTAWVLGERTAGAGNVIGRFISDNHAGGVDVNITGALAVYTNGTFTLKPQAAGDCIRMKYLVSAGGTTGNIYAAGYIPYGII